ncbi:MAG TPA: aminotransferase class III-fold pyridoxal phosphate-dependent enzyme [Gaiellaceae bacterium]
MSLVTDTAQLRERAERRIPGGVNSNVRLDGPRIFFARGKGAWLWDVDGRDYVDYLLGQGPAFLGHAAEPVLRAVTEACAKGNVYGAQHPLEVAAAERLCAVLEWPEMVRLGMTGTEMVQAAIRLARAATGRRRLVRFEGHYHGWLDNVLLAPEPGPAAPASAGQPAEALADSIVLAWNDLGALTELLDREGEDVCAVLMEPMMLNAGAIPPAPGYLEGVRRLCSSHGILLVFDEVITGFRLALGGATARFGVIPDLAVYGKAMAAGWPVAALAGRASLMELFATGRVTHAGTFNANVMGVAATLATLDVLEHDSPYERIEHLGAELMTGLRELAAEASVPLRVRGLPAAFHASFGDDGDVRDFRDVQLLDAARYRRLAEALVGQGVWVAARGIWYVSAAHGEREVEVTLERARAALAGA